MHYILGTLQNLYTLMTKRRLSINVCRFHISTNNIIQNIIELRSLFMAKKIQKLTLAGNVYEKLIPSMLYFVHI